MSLVTEYEGLGIDKKILSNPSLLSMLPKAKQFVDELDTLQYAGANPKELADAFNNLPPDMKVLVKTLKEEKNKEAQLKEAQQKAASRMIGSSVDRVKSPITLAAKKILLETLQ